MDISKGSNYPFGVSFSKDSLNFAIYGQDIETISLCLYHENLTDSPFEKIRLDPEKNKTGKIWHVGVKGLTGIFIYGYEITYASQKDSVFTILDPYAKCIASDPKWAIESREKFTYKPLGKFIPDLFDWENDSSPNIPMKDLIIYEMHVRGFTVHPSSQVKFPGTFKGLMEKIPYLIDLGINAVELMPIQEFCEEDVIHSNPTNKKKLHNYFGYSTVNFFSPMNRFASAQELNPLHELKALIKELHKNKIEVILDIVFNHTFEGNENGPTVSFKGLDRKAYYLINADNKYLNYSGCGNTFNCNHPIAFEFIVNVLRYWTLEYHIDGFRFDLASVFTRGKDGNPLDCAPLIDFLSKDPVLSSKKLIAEPWDAAGLYQLGKFSYIDSRWSEWNGKFQNTVRNFIRGAPNNKKNFAAALSGSHEIFAGSPYSSINYIVSHDGFSLADVVSYNDKHNIENGENNADGVNNYDTWNCGFEGECENKKVLNLRKKQMRNLHLALLVSQGIPMLCMGDEYAHTRKGNNNPWGQDNEINWFLWDQLEQKAEFNRFYKKLIHFRKNSPLLKFENFLTDKEIHWHGLVPNQPEWDKDNKLVAFSLHFPDGKAGLYIAFNALHIYQTVEILPLDSNQSWQWVVNTSLPSPKDFYDSDQIEKLSEKTVRIAPYSAIMLKNY